jgi:type III pantothenate kinase
MLLVVDVGNTNLVFGLYDGERLRSSWRAATDPDRTADEWGALLYTCLATEGLTPAAIDGCIVASVVPGVTAPLRAMSARLLGRPALVVDSTLATGVQMAAEHPREVGPDRLVNAAAAFARYGGPCIVVDCGTATKFEAVNAAGVYLGGAIAPGLRTSAQALFGRAARLYAVDLVAPPTAIGTNTVAAMQAGIVLGFVGLVEGLVTRMRAELAATHPPGTPIPVVATGGLAALLTPHTPRITHTDPTQTQAGLRLIYAMNVKRET